MLKSAIICGTQLGLLFMVACNGRQPIADPEPPKPAFDEESPTWLPINPKAYEHVSSVEDFGDTLRIITTKPPGDTVFSYHLDLKGTSDDKFDGTFTVKSTFRFVPNDTSLPANNKLFVDIRDYRFYYDQKVGYSIMDETKATMPPGVKWEVYGFKLQVLERSPLYMINLTTKEKPKGILIEQYVTEFSGGKQIHVITAHNDTLYLEDFVDYMK